MHVKPGHLPAQVHSGGQSDPLPSASAGREASVLELADLDREVIGSILFPFKSILTFCYPRTVSEPLAGQP